MEHFAYWGMEVHSGAQGKDSKSEVLSSARRRRTSTRTAPPTTARLSDVSKFK